MPDAGGNERLQDQLARLAGRADADAHSTDIAFHVIELQRLAECGEAHYRPRTQIIERVHLYSRYDHARRWFDEVVRAGRFPIVSDRTAERVAVGVDLLIEQEVPRRAQLGLIVLGPEQPIDEESAFGRCRINTGERNLRA